MGTAIRRSPFDHNKMITEIDATYKHPASDHYIVAALNS